MIFVKALHCKEAVGFGRMCRGLVLMEEIGHQKGPLNYILYSRELKDLRLCRVVSINSRFRSSGVADLGLVGI